ncbi:hypothetical protein R6Q59_024512 [Mikania micrantha]
MENLSLCFPSCAKCPFSTGVVSMEELAWLLLKKLTDCSIHMSGMMAYKSSNSSYLPDDTLSNFGDVLSFLELLATKMLIPLHWSMDLTNFWPVVFLNTELGLGFQEHSQLGIDANGFHDPEVDGLQALY